MATTRFIDHLLEGDHASRPAAGDVPEGTLYSCTTHSLVYQSDTATWTTWATLGGGTPDLDAVIAVSGGQDIADALSGAAAPDAGNVFATMADVTGGAGALVLLSSNVVTGSDAANITVTGISGAYKDLYIVCSVRSDKSATVDDLGLQVGNGSIDTGSNYAIYLNYNGGNVTNGSSSLGMYIGRCAGSSATAGYFSTHLVELVNYASTSHGKVGRHHSGFYDGTNISNDEGTSTWKNTSSAIDQVKLYCPSQNLKVGTTMYIYGRT